MGEIRQKHIIPKVILDHWGCTNKCFEPILSPFLIEFSPFRYVYAPSCTLGTYLRVEPRRVWERGVD